MSIIVIIIGIKLILQTESFDDMQTESFNDIVSENVSCLCNSCINNTCVTEFGCYFTIVYETNTGIIIHKSIGCINDHNGKAQSLLGCGVDLSLKRVKQTMTKKKQKTQLSSGSGFTSKCAHTLCCRYEYCNKNVDLTKPCHEEYLNTSTLPSKLLFKSILLFDIIISAAVIVLLALIILNIKYLLKDKIFFIKMCSTFKEDKDNADDQVFEVSSGSGEPVLRNVTIAKQVILLDLLGKGRYGEVWKGDWYGDNVAVKIFKLFDENSWKQETQIYSTIMLCHNNILGFLGSDMTINNDETCLWLVAHYHERGSLYDYLNTHSLNVYEMALFSHSAMCGLAHLHTEIIGMHFKPAIAHRDIKTKNILVKSNGECCIADFGLAVLNSKESNCLDIKRKVGTKRYMAPELLTETMCMTSFEAYKQTDIYSFSLVLWEIARRTKFQDSVEEYQPPYYSYLPEDPSFEEVKEVIVDKRCRPDIPKHWCSDQNLRKFSNLMRECWREGPAERHSALRVKKTLFKLLKCIEAEKNELTINKNLIYAGLKFNEGLKL